MKSIILAGCLVALVFSSIHAEAQLLDRLLNTNGRNNDVDVISNEARDNVAGPQQAQPQIVPRVRDLLKDMMTVNVPSSMGINVLSGLVKVERGQEAERSGLLSNGVRRPLSVRVFGVPVYERGTRVRPLDSGSAADEVPVEGLRPTKPDDEELPL